MTSDGDALLRAILAHPAEDTPRLVYADWLQEHGDESRAEFIRVQIAHPDGRVWCLSPVKVNQYSRRQCGKCRVCVAHAAFRKHLAAWSPEVPCLVVAYSHAYDRPGPFIGACRLVLSFARGFVDCCEDCSPDDWLVYGKTICEEHPVRRVRLTATPDATSGWPHSGSSRIHANNEMECSAFPGIIFELPA